MKYTDVDTARIEKPAIGRGAWTKGGIDFLNRYAVAPAGAVRIGLSCEKGHAYVAAAAGAGDIQLRLEELGLMTFNHDDLGIFGAKTGDAVKAFQRGHRDPRSLQPLVVDGIFGTGDARALYAPLIHAAEVAHGIPAGLLLGILTWESALDPGAVGYSTPADRGIAQINDVHEDMPWEKAFDSRAAITWAAAELVKAHNDFGTWDLAILNHNSPRRARWTLSGEILEPEHAADKLSAEAYVAHVRSSIYPYPKEIS